MSMFIWAPFTLSEIINFNGYILLRTVIYNTNRVRRRSKTLSSTIPRHWLGLRPERSLGR